MESKWCEQSVQHPSWKCMMPVYFTVKSQGHLFSRKFTVGVDNQALSWLKTYSTYHALTGRWIIALEKNPFKLGKPTRIQHHIAVGLKKEPTARNSAPKTVTLAGKRKYLSLSKYEQLPRTPLFDVQGRVKPRHPDLPEYLRRVKTTALSRLVS